MPYLLFLFNSPIYRRKTISYVTDGQIISRNLRKANVVDFLKNLSGFNIDRVHIENKFGEE